MENLSSKAACRDLAGTVDCIPRGSSQFQIVAFEYAGRGNVNLSNLHGNEVDAWDQALSVCRRHPEEVENIKQSEDRFLESEANL
jgi:hypothetical protein